MEVWKGDWKFNILTGIDFFCAELQSLCGLLIFIFTSNLNKKERFRCETETTGL